MKRRAEAPKQDWRQLRGLALAADPDRALAAGFAPREAASLLWAVILFEAELRRAIERVPAPFAGAIRLQWRREWVDSCCQTGEDADTRVDAYAPPDLAALSALFAREPAGRSAALALIAWHEDRLDPILFSDEMTFLTQMRYLAGQRMRLCAAALNHSAWQPGSGLLDLATAGVALEWLRWARRPLWPGFGTSRGLTETGAGVLRPISDIERLALVLGAEWKRARTGLDHAAIPVAVLPALASLALDGCQARFRARERGTSVVAHPFPLRSRLAILRVMMLGRV